MKAFTVPKTYEEYIIPYLDNFIEIKVPQEKINKIKAFIPELIEAKMQEKQHKRNHVSEEKRWYTGLLGEAAVEEFLGIEIIDWTIGDSNDYDKPDIEEIGCGIKTVEWGYFPLINYHNEYPQIICLKKSEDTVLICGIADPEILNTYQDSNLVIIPLFRRTRTGFYGFEYLR